MKDLKGKHIISRRALVESSLFGLLAISVPNILFSRNIPVDINLPSFEKERSSQYPYIPDDVVSEVVGKSHFNLERVKELVDRWPELSRATWDWRFGDWETAIGAASHVGRRDIILYLMSKGARPDIFTFAALGDIQTVKSIITYAPGAQLIAGPHGISLLQHAKNGLRRDDLLTTKHKSDFGRLIDYLESLGDADGPQFDTLSAKDQEIYLGDYRYGDGEGDGFTVGLNMADKISLGGLGSSGGSLDKIGEHRFLYNRSPSVKISFQFNNSMVTSITVEDPDLTVVAHKI